MLGVKLTGYLARPCACIHANLVLCVCLSAKQVRVVSKNLLTAEGMAMNKLPYLQGQQNPFDKGCLRNWVAFLRLKREPPVSTGAPAAV
jgi:hypothetical protein